MDILCKLRVVHFPLIGCSVGTSLSQLTVKIKPITRRQERLMPFLCEHCAVVRKGSVFPVRAADNCCACDALRKTITQWKGFGIENLLGCSVGTAHG